MKKLFFVFCLMASVSMLCVSCGGSDGDDDRYTECETDYDAEFFDPCISWGATVEQVKSYMAAYSDWELQSTSNGYALIYINEKTGVMVMYMFNMSFEGLYSASVTYPYNANNWTKLYAHTTSKYGVTLEDWSTTEDKVYGCNTTVNGKYVGIALKTTTSQNTMTFLIQRAEQ